MQTITVDEKAMASIEHVDNKLDLSDPDAEKALRANEHLDRFGSHAKVDPGEIALVRKLDIHIMVCSSLHWDLSSPEKYQTSDIICSQFSG
jgi:hypothetical protein